MFETRRVTYNRSDWPFARIVKTMLGVSAELDDLQADNGGVWKVREDQSSAYHQRFYGSLEHFLPVYRSFVRELIVREGMSAGHVYFQRVPSFRVHLPDNVAVGEEHRDGDYGHADGEINYWLPVTDAFDTNTVWIEGEPEAVRHGQILVFDGVNRLHGNRINRTGKSRVSFDFRILPKSLYRPRADRSVSAGLRFVVGEYWDLF